MKYLYLLLFASVAASGCLGLGQCKSKETCIVEGEFFPAFAGFTHDEIDTIITRKYRTGTNYTDLVDSYLTDSLRQLGYIQSRYYARDTPTMYTLVDSGSGRLFYTPKYYRLLVNEGFEYEIEVPATGRKYRLGNVVLDGDVSKNLKYDCNSDGDDRRCFRYLVSYTFEGERFSANGRIIKRDIVMYK